MVDQFDNKGPFVDRVDLDGENVDGSPVRADAPRCSLDVQMQLVDGRELTSQVLRLQSFSGQEGISQPFEFTLDLRLNDYTQYESTPQWALIEPEDGLPRLTMDALLGASVTVMIGQPETEEEANNAYPENRPVSYFNGVVFDVSMKDRGVWGITMKPRLAMLGLQSRYRVFEGQTILDVVSKVLGDNGIAFTSSALLADGSIDADATSPVVTGLATYRTQSWMQAGETDLDFLNRLMEKAGLFFYFVHSQYEHIMVLTDQSYYQALHEPVDIESFEGLSSGSNLRRLFLTSPVLGVDFEDSISEFSLQRSLAVQGVSTILAGKQSSWQSEDPAEVAPVYRDDRLANPTLSMEKMLLVSFGASERELDIRKEQIEKQLLSAKSSFSGSSGLPEMRSGYVFALEETRGVLEDDQDNERRNPSTRNRGKSLLQSKYPGRLPPSMQSRTHRKQPQGPSEQDLGPIRPELDGAEMVAVTVSHNATIDGKYSNQFSAYDRFGYGKAYQAAGDQDGSIIAQVCDKTGNIDRAAITPLNRVTKFVKANVVSRYFMPKTDFVEKHQKTFTALGSKDGGYAAQGVYVQFINSDESSTPVWVRLSDGMTTIPERGTFVMVSRARDETEIPEVSQVLDSVGSRTVMPKKYSKNTSWGDSYSTSYGDSYRVSVPNVPKTAYDTFTELVNKQRETDSFNDVSFSESSSSNFSVAERSRSVSVAGTATAEEIKSQAALTPAIDGYTQVSRSVTYGDTYGASEQVGDQFSESTNVGFAKNLSTHTGNQHSESTVIGSTFSLSDQVGDAVSQSSNTLVSSENSSLTNISTSNTTDSISYSNVGVSFANSATGLSNSNNVVGVSISTNLTNSSLAISATGLNMSENVTGVNQSASLTLANISESVTGMHIGSDATVLSATSNAVDVSVSSSYSGASVAFDMSLNSQRFTNTGSGWKADVSPAQPETAVQGTSINIITQIHISL